MTPQRRRGILIGSISVLAAATAIYLCVQQEVLWVLVPIPALVGIMYHLLNLEPRYNNRMSVAALYRQFLRAFHGGWSKSAAPDVSEDAAEDLTTHQPKFSSTLWSAALLTAVLAVPAAVSGGGVDLFLGSEVPSASQTGGITPGRKLGSEATGLVFAGLGVYAMIILRMVGRVNSGSLHARFMMTAALRATIAQVLGYFAGAVNFFAGAPSVGNTGFFLIGLFYPLFVDRLRDMAYDIFFRKKVVAEPLDVKLIDGIDDGVVEMLDELGVTDAQHIASSDPAVLTVRSLYPFERVVDWIDQAMLIRRFRERVTDLRKLNIRGITDWIPLMEPIVTNGPEKADSEAVLGYIATAVGEPIEVVRVFGRAAYNDYKTNLLWRLCQHRLDVAAQVATAAATPRIPIAAPAAATVPAASQPAVSQPVVSQQADQ